MQVNVVYVNNYVKKLDVNVQKCRLFVKISFDISLIINQVTHLSLVFNRPKIIHFVINNNVHCFKLALIYQMNSTTTANKRSHYSYLTNARSQSMILAEKYLYLLEILHIMRSDIRRSYAGSRTSMENLRKRILKARTIVLQCKDLCTRREYDHCQILMPTSK